ncbi:uncharacterized protein LOC114536635 [Dendronephthya gigantea]|uniref:uncharacterized protein LOC114536635 n=1 Tax=Dendronephthya gigantea TaxID=151771 RepID=UPI00106C6BD1|nr:uncharacterized protein LOC114536635 [Dendronephthya gigantea]
MEPRRKITRQSVADVNKTLPKRNEHVLPEICIVCGRDSSWFSLDKVTKKRRRTPLMLAETIDAGLLRTAAERKNDERILVQIRGKDCVALDVRYHKVCYCNYTNFLTRETKKQLETERSTVYEKSYDVFCKKVIETEVIANKQIRYMKDLLEKFVIIAKDTENVDASKYRAFKLKQRLMKSYPQLVFYVPKMRNVSEIVYVENLDSSELVEEHMSNKSENNDEDFDEESYTGTIMMMI